MDYIFFEKKSIDRPRKLILIYMEQGMGKEIIWRLFIFGSLLIIQIPQIQALQAEQYEVGQEKYGAPVADQGGLITMDPLFFALIVNGGQNVETDNLISFEKTTFDPVRIMLSGYFHVDTEELRDHVYFTLYRADGSVMANYQHATYDVSREFYISGFEPLGVYVILIDLGIPPNEPLECCAKYNYYISYAGLDNPPHVQSLGDGFEFYPAWGYTNMRNEGGMHNFSFFGTPEDYVLYHQPWGPNNVVEAVTLYDRNDTEIPLELDKTQSKIKWFFTLDQVGYFDFVIDFTNDPLLNGRYIGFKLATWGQYSEEEATIINLYAGRISNTDSDLDGIPDSEEYGSGTSPHIADTDGDTFGDLLEIDLGTDPNLDTSKPFQFDGEVLMQPDKHTFSVTITSDIDIMPYTNIRYTFDLNPNFVVNDEDTISGEITDWDFDSMRILIETENNSEVPDWFAFHMRLHFEKDVGGDVWGVGYYSARISPERTYTNETRSFDPSVTPSLAVPIPLPTFMFVVTLVILPLIRRGH